MSLRARTLAPTAEEKRPGPGTTRFKSARMLLRRMRRARAQYTSSVGRRQEDRDSAAELLQSRRKSVVARSASDEATPKALLCTVEIASPPKTAARNDSVKGLGTSPTASHFAIHQQTQ